tara:strand:- start:469 stop:996 length:528 start_codon:yes stop_codon:yes gene_type:complete
MVINIAEKKKKKKPIAVRGKKTKKAKVMDQMRKRLQAKTPAQIKGKGMSPGMKKAVTGSAVGMGGAGLMALARKLKPTGRLNAADLKRVKEMMGKKSGGKLMTKKDAETLAKRLNRRSRLQRRTDFKVVDTGQKGKGILSKLPVQASGKRFNVKMVKKNGNVRKIRPGIGFARKK